LCRREGNAAGSLDPATAGLGMTVLILTPENDEDAGEEGDDSWNKAEVESKHCNQANENQIDRQQKHSDVFVKPHRLSMISERRALSRQITEGRDDLGTAGEKSVSQLSTAASEAEFRERRSFPNRVWEPELCKAGDFTPTASPSPSRSQTPVWEHFRS
jgi:hypothetical protein